jgi:hypothetical protein|nr:MAG TPA: chromosome partitioning protein [Caudoviricetes sp.]
METTKDYERFKLLEFNRKGLDRNHINKIKDSISKNGYIGNPILVNDDFEIFDGQHRFTALKEMGLEVPYEIRNIAYDSIIDLNITQKKWGIEDYVNYYCEKDKNPNYTRLKRLCNELKCGCNLILIMGFRVCINGDIRKKVKDGSLSFKMDEELKVNQFYKNFMTIAQNLKMKPATKMCSALADLSTRRGFNWTIMINKTSKYPTLAYNCRTQEEFIVMLKNIYNFNTRLAENRI